MKKLILAALSSILCGGALAEGDSVIAYTLREDGTTNTWTQAELQAALGLINRMYKREIGTDAGRRRWHGDRIGQYILPTGETNAAGRAVFVRVDLYSDGFVATNRAVRSLIRKKSNGSTFRLPPMQTASPTNSGSVPKSTDSWQTG